MEARNVFNVEKKRDKFWVWIFHDFVHNSGKNFDFFYIIVELFGWRKFFSEKVPQQSKLAHKIRQVKNVNVDVV